MGVALTRFYQLEARAQQLIVSAMVPRPRGRQKTAEGELQKLRQELFCIPGPVVPDHTNQLFRAELAILSCWQGRTREARIHEVLEHLDAQARTGIDRRFFITKQR